jgi:hypothetical protein
MRKNRYWGNLRRRIAFFIKHSGRVLINLLLPLIISNERGSAMRGEPCYFVLLSRFVLIKIA